MEQYTPTVYRISRKMANNAIPLLNKKRMFVDDIVNYVNKDAVKRVAGITNATGISSVYVGDNRKAGTAHFLLPYNDEYQRGCGNQPVYGNIIIVLGEKTYNELADNLKTTDITTITL